ncbi:unnamed protein product, partial [Phaeothamnion confervicola]
MMMLIEKLAADGRISDTEAVEVRRAIFPDGAVSRAEAEALFHLNERVKGDDPAWDACFVEAICDHLMLADEPQGHVTEEGAYWLETRIGRDGVVEGPTELELVLKLMEKAQSCPTRLHEFARKSALHAIRQNGGTIGEFDLVIIRRVLFAAAGAGNIAITREEAEWLFEIDEATAGNPHVSGWRDLFVSAVMNHLFAAGPSSLLDRDSMLRRANWLNSSPAGGTGAFLSRLIGRLSDGGVEGYASRAKYDAAEQQHAYLDQRAVEAHVAEALDTGEAAWLVARMRRDGRRTVNEQAL